MSRLEEIQARADKASPGPWEWRGNAKYHSIRLITWMKGLGIGQTTVMDFARAGMHDAEPRFRDEHFMMKRGRDLVRYEVCHSATRPDDPKVYRHDIDGIRHPDAEFIAHSRDDVEWLLNRVRELEAKVAAAWSEGAQAEAEERDGEDTITMTCSLANPYLEWEPTGEPNTYSSRPVVP